MPRSPHIVRPALMEREAFPQVFPGAFLPRENSFYMRILSPTATRRPTGFDTKPL